jgi:predicted permease
MNAAPTRKDNLESDSTSIGHWVEDIVGDIRFGLRMLGKSPGVTAVVVLALALGVGANTAIFGIVNSFLLRPLPVSQPDQITVLAIQQRDAPPGSSGFSYPEFSDFRAHAGGFSGILGVVLSPVKLTAGDRSEECVGNYVSSNFFSTLGLQPSLGRTILPDDGETPGERPLVVLDHAYWKRRFNSDPGIVGRPIRVNGVAGTIVGVAPADFHGMFFLFETDAYVSMSAMSTEDTGNMFWSSRDLRRILAFGRRKPGVTLAQAQGSLDVVTAQEARDYPSTERWFTVRAIPELSSRPIAYANNSFVAISRLFLILAGFVLLLASTNVENILLARGAARQREMGLRAALGAGRSRLMRQMLTESLLLAALGGGFGVALAVWANSWLNSIHLPNVPLQLNSVIDWRVFIFAAATVLLIGFVVGLLPAIRASSGDVNSVLHGGPPGRPLGLHRAGVRNFLVVAQVAGSLVLLVAAGLFVRSLVNVQQFDLGFDPDHLLNVVLDPHQIGYDEVQTGAFYRDLRDQVRSLPGVQSASFASYIPMGGFPTRLPVLRERNEVREGVKLPEILFNAVDPEYFGTMRIALLQGRAFRDADDAGALPVAIVNRTMAAQLWPGENPVGRRFSMNGATGPFAQVVGVVADGKYGTVAEDPQPFFYLPTAQYFVSRRALQIRTWASPESLAAPVKEAIARLGAGNSILDIQTMRQFLGGALGFLAFRLAAILAGALGMVGFALAIVGVYGIISFTVGQRTQELGIRVALGASPRDILNLVWMQGVRLVAAGIAIGIPAAWAVTRTMSHHLAGLAPGDPLTYVAVACVALVACWIPARRATNVDPMVALRYE